jgi:hypothetical protein
LLLAAAGAVLLGWGPASSLAELRPLDRAHFRESSNDSLPAEAARSIRSKCQGVFLNDFILELECGGRDVQVCRLRKDFGVQAIAQGLAILARDGRIAAPRTLDSSAAWYLIGWSDGQGGRSHYGGMGSSRDGSGTDVFHCLASGPDGAEDCSALLDGLRRDGLEGIETHESDSDTLHFLHRRIPAGNGCRYLSGRNYQCPGHGQLSWSVHDDRRDADDSQRRAMRQAEALEGARLVESRTMGCRIEGVGSTCETRRIAIAMDPDPDETLHVVYGIVPVAEGHLRVACSFFDMERGKDGLAPLCNEVIRAE